MRPASAAALLAIALAATGCSEAATDDDKLANVRGKGFGATPAFFPEHPWTVTYSWDCSKQLSEGRKILQKARLSVLHADDGAEVENNAHVEHNGKKGDGKLTYERPGAYTVSITTECDFQLRVEEERDKT